MTFHRNVVVFTRVILALAADGESEQDHEHQSQHGERASSWHTKRSFDSTPLAFGRLAFA
jgi:hypothetical protein